MNAEKILSRLDKVRSNGQNRWMACCPAHNDKTPSLAIQELNDGRILMRCFAGCETSQVLTSMGLTSSDLFPNGGLGEFKGWQQLERDHEVRQQKKQRSRFANEIAILRQANAERKAGHRLSRRDMEIERRAFMKLKQAGVL